MKMIEALERRQLLSAVAVFVPCSSTLFIAYSSDVPSNTLTVTETATRDQNGNVTGNTVTAFDNQAGLDVPIDDGSHPDGVYTNVQHIVLIGANTDDNITYQGDDLGAAIFGNGGNDTIQVVDGTGQSTVFGGDGNDMIQVGGNSNTIISGGNGDDTVVLFGSGSGELIDAGNGNDTVVNEGFLQNSTILGGNGNDTIINDGVMINDVVNGGNGNDILINNGVITGGTYNGGNGTDTLQNTVDAVNVSGIQVLSATLVQNGLA